MYKMMIMNCVVAQKMIITPDVLNMNTLNAAEAYFTVRLDTAPDYDMIVNFTSNAVTFSNCQSAVFSVDNWQIDQQIYIDRQSVFSSLSVDMSSAEILAEMFNIETNTIVQNRTISLKDLRPNKGSSCYSTGDPHFVTFNNQQYDYQSYHTVWLLQSPFLSVQCLQMPCNNYVTCNIACSIQVSDGINYAYFLTSANGTSAKLATTKVRDDNNLLNNYLFHQIISEQNWKFIFKDGSQVNLVGRTWPTADQGYLDVYIFVPTKYKYLTAGLCGVWDDNSTTLMMPNGTSLNFIDKSKSASNVLLFTNSWTIQNSSVAYNQIYNVINGTTPNPINFTTMYKFQPYINSVIQQKFGSSLQTIIQKWSGNTFKQCMKPLKVLPTLVKTPTGLLNSKPFTINWHAIKRYTKWGKYTPLIKDPLRYYPGYLYRGNFLKKRQITNTTEISNATTTDTTPEITTPEITIVEKEPQILPQDLIFIQEQCKQVMVAENCQQIVPNEYLNHIENCIGDVKHVWFITDIIRTTSIITTLNNHKQAFLEHCKQASENFLALIPMQVAIVIDDILSQTNKTILKRDLSEPERLLTQLETIIGNKSSILTVIKAQMNNGFGSFQHTQTCLNGGVTLSSGGCECTNAYAGIHCENKVIIPATDASSTDDNSSSTDDNSSSTDDNSSSNNPSTDDNSSSNNPSTDDNSSSNNPSTDDNSSIDSSKISFAKKYEHSFILFVISSILLL